MGNGFARLRRRLGVLAVAAAGAGAVVPAHALVNFDVSFNDPGNQYAIYYGAITQQVRAAGEDWVERFLGLTVSTTLQVSVGFASIATANGGSATSALLSTGAGGVALYEQGAARKLRTGEDLNGSAPDILFNIGINGYLQDELWFDPSPFSSSPVVPSTRTDALSVFRHEFGHAFGFNGWRDGTTGALPGAYQSTFDQWVVPQTTAGVTTLFFTGPNAMAVYGGPVPVTFGNYSHIANAAPRPGQDLVSDLMNGVVYQRGSRYEISALDMAIMADAGLPVAAVPEPQAWALMAVGVVLLSARRRWAAQRPSQPR